MVSFGLLQYLAITKLFNTVYFSFWRTFKLKPNQSITTSYILSQSPSRMRLQDSDLIKAHQDCHPPHSPTDFQPLTAAKKQESAVVTATFWRLPQIKESSRIFFACLALIQSWLQFVLNYTEEQLCRRLNV